MNAVSAPAQLVGEPPLSSARTSIQELSRARPRPGRLTLRLLQLQYWYDRLSEPQRLLVGVAVIIFLVTSWLYVLGLGSWVLVNRIEALGPEPAASSDQIVTQLPEVVVPEQPAPAQPTAVPTAAVEVSDSLIQPPDVPEVPIIPAPPRAVVPVVPIKPRVVATVVSTPAPVVTAGPPSAPTRTTLQATPVATPARTGTPLNGAGATNGAATPVRTQAPAATATPARVGATATLPRAPTPTPTRR